jgi:hypothetical protein
MALFKGKGDNLSRANAIIAKMSKQSEDADPVTPPAEPVEPTTPEGGQQVQQQEPAEPAQPETPPAPDNDTPPAEPVSSTEGDPPAEPESGVATPPETPEEPKPEPVVPPQPAEITDDLVFNKLSEMLGKEVKSVEDLQPEAPELDPELAQLKEWSEKTGLPISKWPEYSRDFSKMSDMDVAREILSQKYPSFTSEELDYSLKQFVYDEDADEEGDRMKKSIALKKFAHEGRAQLEKNKLTLAETAKQTAQPSLTKEQQDALKAYSEIQEQSKVSKERQQAYEQGITQASQSLDALDLKLSDELTLKYNVPVEVKNSLPKAVAEMPNWYNPDGSFNHQNIVKDVAKITNFEAIMDMVFKQGIEVGKEGKINPRGASVQTDPGAPPVTPQGEPKGNIKEVVSSITGRGTRPKMRFGKRE